MKIMMAVQTGTGSIPVPRPDALIFTMPGGAEIRAGWHGSSWDSVDKDRPAGSVFQDTVTDGFSAILEDVTLDGAPAAGKYRDILGAQYVRFETQSKPVTGQAEICVLDEDYDVVMHRMPMK